MLTHQKIGSDGLPVVANYADFNRIALDAWFDAQALQSLKTLLQAAVSPASLWPVDMPESHWQTLLSQPWRMPAVGHEFNAGALVWLDDELDAERVLEACTSDNSPLWLGVQTLGEPVARVLAQVQGPLHLTGLAAAPDGVAAVLAKRPGETLLGIQVLTQDTLEYAMPLLKPFFDKQPGSSLHLPALKTLDEAGAKALAACKRDLHMNGLESMDESAAKALTKCTAPALSFKGLALLQHATATAFEDFVGHLHIHAGIGQQALKVLLAQSRRGTFVYGVESLSAGGGEHGEGALAWLCTALAESDAGNVGLPDVAQIDEGAMELLAGMKASRLRLGKLTALTRLQALQLAARRPDLIVQLPSLRLSDQPPAVQAVLKDDSTLIFATAK